MSLVDSSNSLQTQQNISDMLLALTRQAWLKMLNLCIDSKTDSYDAWHACTVNTN